MWKYLQTAGGQHTTLTATQLVVVESCAIWVWGCVFEWSINVKLRMVGSDEFQDQTNDEKTTTMVYNDTWAQIFNITLRDML